MLRKEFVTLVNTGHNCMDDASQCVTRDKQQHNHRLLNTKQR
jgi:hypothetical protein